MNKRPYVESGGRSYDHNTDFLKELYATIGEKGGGSPWLRQDLPSLSAALYEWSVPILADPILGPRLSEAALTFIETAPLKIAPEAAAIPWEGLPDAVERGLRLLEKEPERFADPNAVGGVLWQLFLKHPQDPQLVEFLRREAAKPQTSKNIQVLAERYLGKNPPA